MRSPDTGYIFTVPVKETGRWHDAHCSFISICVPHSRRGNGDFSGVFFHEACWALLEECLLGKPVPLEQFLDVFQSLVFTHGLRSRHSLLLKYEYNGSLDDENSLRDPYHVPKIQEILNSPSTLPPRPRKKSRNHQTCNQDRFLRLPAEMIEEIAAFLSTKDVLSLRHASRAFTPLFYSQGFWSTRFKVHGDKGFLFEIRKDENRKVRDWRALYRYTNKKHLSTEVINRIRVWSLCQSLMELILLEWSNWQASEPMPKASPGCRWETAEEKPENNYDNYNNLELCYYEQKAPIISLPSSVGVFIVHDGLQSYISGINIFSEDGSEIRLGYASSKRVCMDVSGGVRGFIPAIGEKGIQAMLVVDGDGFISPWLGNPSKGTQTMRLVFKGPISALETKKLSLM